MENKLPKRKSTRMKYFDYSRNGAYFITICTQGRKCILLKINKTMVGEGSPLPNLTVYGEIVENNIKSINAKFSNAVPVQYVIMPNHIHIILTMINESGGKTPPLQYHR